MNYKILKPTFLEEIIPFTQAYINRHIIVDLTDFTVEPKDIVSFKKTAIKLNNNGTSFVFISMNIEIDQIPDEINIVPTLQEAIDVIEMDQMMRDL